MKLPILLTVFLLASPLCAEIERIPVPGQEWSLIVDAPALFHKQERRGTDSYVFRATSGRFNLSFFSEKPQRGMGGHEQCFKFYWPKALRNPMIDEKSIMVSHTDDYYRVEYVILVETPGKTVTQRNVNYYFAFAGRWMDVHVSIVEPELGDDEVLRRFDRGLRYEMDESKPSPPDTASKSSGGDAPADGFLKAEGLRVSIPSRWKEISPQAPQPQFPVATYQFVPTDARNALAMVSVVGRDRDEFADVRFLRNILIGDSRPYVSGPDELNRIPVKSLAVEGGLGVHASFVDPSLVGKPVQIGNYKTATVVYLSLGRDYLIKGTILCDDMHSWDFREAMDLLQSLRRFTK